jgi:hypothetical protein
VIRHSCRMLAPSLHSTNMESYKMAPSRGRFLMDSRASHPSLVQGMIRPTMNSLRSRPRVEDNALAPSRFRGHRCMDPATQEESRHYLEESWRITPSGRPSLPRGPHATPSCISFIHGLNRGPTGVCSGLGT